jgi:NAD(P)-dependent dehydrogenase (short-subunit alcohol dehydrogenase family)
LLREGLLEGISVLVAVAPGQSSEGTLGEAVREACMGLGARVSTCRPVSESWRCVEEASLDADVATAVGPARKLDLLAVDAAALLAGGLERLGCGQEALGICMEAVWNVTRAAVRQAFLDASPPGGRIVYLAPGRDPRARGGGPNVTDGTYADGVRAGLENLSRTLSIEWARHSITTVTILPAREAPPSGGGAAALTAYLASPGGAYFSGCLLDLGGV